MVATSRQRLLVGALAASLALNVGFVAYLAQSGGLRRILLKLDLVSLPSQRASFQIKDEERFRLLPNTPAEVVFAGDSLIAHGPWSEFYSEIHNRGIGGERTDGLLGRLDEILASKPHKIIFLIGSNDLSQAVPVPQILRNYRTILTRVQAESPDTQVFVSALLPVNPTLPDAPVYSNAEVRAVNEPLGKLVAEFPAARFFDLTARLVDDKGLLKEEYSQDGLHLNIKGYLAVEQQVRLLLDGS